MNFERLKKLLSYAPQAVINRILRDLRPATAPILRKVSGAVIYVHFAPHSATFEHVAALYEAITACVVDEFDGDIVHMHVAGFAVLWDRERTSESLGTLALRALHVAYRIRTLAQMPRYAHAALPLPAIGVARGPLALLFIGGVNGLWHYVLGGAPLMRASVAALSGAPGSIVLDEDDWRALEPYAHGIVAEPLGGDVREELVVLRGEPAASRSQPMTIGDRAAELDGRLQRRLEHLGEIEQLLFTYVPVPVSARLRNHEEQSLWLTDVRTVAAVTVRLSALRYDEAHCDEVHSAVSVIQSFANHFGGFLLSVYTRGNDTCASVVFGLPPVDVENLPPLATTMSLELLQTFRRGDAYLDVCAGVATGRVVGGSVGSTRRHVHLLCGAAITESEQMAFAASAQTVTVDDATWSGLNNFTRRPSTRPTWWVVSRRRNSFTKRQPVETELLDSINADAQASTLDALLDETALFVASGTARLVLVEGAIGTGKRRVMTSYLHALQETDFGAGDAPPLVLESRGDPTERNTPFFVWRGIFAQLLEAAACATMEELIDACPMLIDVCKEEPPAVLHLLSTVLPPNILLVHDPHIPVPNGEDQVYRQTGRILIGLLLELVPEASKVAVLGSCACVDTHSWNMILSLHQTAPTVMLVLFARPVEPRVANESQQRQLLAAPDVLVLRMAPWSRQHICQLVCAVTRAGAIDDRVADLIVLRASGNPFFATELALALVESGRVSVQPLASAPAAAQTMHSIFMSPNAASALSVVDSSAVPRGVVLAPVAPDSLTSGTMPFPSTMQGVIQRRVDSLSGVQQLVLRVAAVIGEVFEPQLLIDIMPLKVGVDVRRHIGELCDMEFFESAVINAKAFRLPHKATARAVYVVLNDGKLASVVGDTVKIEHHQLHDRSEQLAVVSSSDEEADGEVGESGAGGSGGSGGAGGADVTCSNPHMTDDAEDAENASSSDEYSEQYEYESVTATSSRSSASASASASESSSASESPSTTSTGDEWASAEKSARKMHSPQRAVNHARRLRADTNHSGSSLRDEDEDGDEDLDLARSDEAPNRTWNFLTADRERVGTVSTLSPTPMRLVKPRFRATVSDLRSATSRNTLPVAQHQQQQQQQQQQQLLQQHQQQQQQSVASSPTARTSPTASDDEQAAAARRRTRANRSSPATAAAAAPLRKHRVRVRRSRRMIKADNDDMQSAESETNGLGASGSIQQFGFDVARKNSPATNNNWRSESPVSKSFEHAMTALGSHSPADSSGMGVSSRAGGTGAAWSLGEDVRAFQALRATGMSTLLQFVNLSVQQSVYDMILPTQRRQLHVLVAEWYEDRYRGHLEPYWALLAHHWSSAERALGVHDAQSGPLLKKTIFYLAKAAEHARLMSANRVATEYYQSLLRIVRERPGSVDVVTVIEWASLCARTFARLGDIERTIELCRYAIDVAGFDQPESGTLSKLYRRIVPARLRQHSGNNASALASTSGGSGSMSGGGGGGGGGGNMSETYATRVQALISSVYVTLTFVYMTMNEPSIAIECGVLGHACGEKAGDAVMTADAQGMLCAIRGAAGDLNGAIAARGRAIIEMQVLRSRHRVSYESLGNDTAWDGHSLKAQLMRVLLTTAHGIASCGYTKTAFDDMARFNAYPELPEAAKALLSQSICLWALGRLSEAAVFIERSLLVSPEDIVLRRWCFVRAAFLTSLGCPDVARAVLDQEQRLDPLLRDLADELERTRAGGAPSTPANLLVGYDRLLFLGAASVVSVAQLHVDECVAYLRIAAAHTQTACASIQAGMALCNLADAAVQLALYVRRDRKGECAPFAASAMQMVEFHVKRFRCCHARLFRGWQRLFDGYLALLGGKLGNAIDIWTDAIAESSRELPLLPTSQSSAVWDELLLTGHVAQLPPSWAMAQRLSDASPTSGSEFLDDDSDLDDDVDVDDEFSSAESGAQDVLLHEKFSAALRTTQSLRRASNQVFGGRVVVRCHSGPLTTLAESIVPEIGGNLLRAQTTARGKDSTSDSSQEARSEGRAFGDQLRRVSLTTSGGIKRDIAPDSPMLNDKDSPREGRQPYLLARLYDAIGQHLVARKSGHERLVVRKRLQYLQMAHKLYAQIGATAELRKCADRIGALAVVNADQSLQAFRGRN